MFNFQRQFVPKGVDFSDYILSLWLILGQDEWLEKCKSGFDRYSTERIVEFETGENTLGRYIIWGLLLTLMFSA